MFFTPNTLAIEFATVSFPTPESPEMEISKGLSFNLNKSAEASSLLKELSDHTEANISKEVKIEFNKIAVSEIS